MPGSTNLRDCKVLKKMVKMYAEKGELYDAICAAPAVTLAHWGMLKGLKATCYPSFMEKFTSEVIPVNSRVVVDRNVVTSQGPGTAIEFALALVEQLYDKEKMEEVAGPLGTPCPLYFEFCGDGSHLTPKREWSDVRVVRKLRGLRQQEKFAARSHFRGLRDSQQAGGRRPTPLFMLAMDNLRDRKLAEQRTRDSDISEYLTCPLCGQVMIDPVTIAAGKTFDQQFLKDWFEKKGLVCPLTGEPVSGAIVRNERIRGYLKEWEDSKAELIAKSGKNIYPAHPSPPPPAPAPAPRIHPGRRRPLRSPRASIPAAAGPCARLAHPSPPPPAPAPAPRVHPRHRACLHYFPLYVVRRTPPAQPPSSLTLEPRLSAYPVKHDARRRPARPPPSRDNIGGRPTVSHLALGACPWPVPHTDGGDSSVLHRVRNKESTRP